MTRHLFRSRLPSFFLLPQTSQDLWMVMPFVAGGSVLHIMKYNYPEVGRIARGRTRQLDETCLVLYCQISYVV